jgi:hypothetical protein
MSSESTVMKEKMPEELREKSLIELISRQR